MKLWSESLVLFSAAILLSTPIFASVREGTDAFRKGEYSKAAEIFEQAAKESPEDLRLEFNRGSALVATGKLDAAIEALRKSAVAADPAIASKSLVLLGQIAVSRSKESMNESSEIPDPSRRKEILDQLRLAEQFYAEALEIDPSERSAPTALEQIRAWRSRTLEQWNLADRIPERQQAIPERLRQLEEWERSIGRSIGENRDATDSPKKFQTYYETAKDQRRLTDEVVALQNDLKQIPTDPNGKDETEVQTVQAFLDELDRLRASTENVEQKLRSFQGREASDKLRESVDRISRLRIHLSPFESIVREAEKKQDELCNADSLSTPADGEFRASDQRRIADWMPSMVRRAQQGLQEEGQDAEHSVEESQALKQSMELAVQYGPEIQKLAQNAARFLKNGDPEAASHDQRQALERLREILKPLENQQDRNQQEQDPDRQQNPEQDQNQQNQNRSDQEQDSTDSNSQDPKSRDQGRQDQESRQGANREPRNHDPENMSSKSQNGDSDEGDRDEKESNPENGKDPEKERKKQNGRNARDVDAEKKDESLNPDDPKAISPEKKREIEKAERMLRQVRRKQQEVDERRQRVRALLLQLEPVDKDW